MIMLDGQAPFIEEDDDFIACADTLSRGGFLGEFAFSGPPTPDIVERAALAGFMPMSATAPDGFTLLLPKLHIERCILDPARMALTGTVRRNSGLYSISLNLAFSGVLEQCAKIHGEDWLSPALRESFIALHRERASRKAAWVSAELWRDGRLEAGEIGYLIGDSYASLSGFRLVSGSGSVQLAGLGALLNREGVRVWDLGMPMDYKLRLGGQELDRNRYLKILKESYAANRIEAISKETDPIPVRELLARRIPL